MERIKIELLPDGNAKFTENEPTKKEKSAFQTLIKTSFYTLIFIIVGVSIFTYRIVTLDTSVSGHSATRSLFAQVRSFMGFSDDILIGQNEDRINILLLGKGGVGHEGPELTDTIILASIKPSSEQVSLVSIPRDLVIWQEEHQWRKVNNANAFDGGEFAMKVIGNAIDEPIHYYITVDFNGVEKIVDTLGGLKINVEKAFTDPLYPTEDFKTQTISFKKGSQTMNGEQVLQFVRSRHGTNGEGSDFGRARRQQLVLEALRSQILSIGILLNPTKINTLLKTVDQNVATNLESNEIARLAGMVREFENIKPIRLVLDDSPNGFLISQITEEGAYILTPRFGSFSEIAFEIEHIFTPTTARPTPIKVAVRNGTLVTGLANKASEVLEKNNLFVTQIENATRRDWETSTLYKLTGKPDSKTLSWLASTFNAEVSIGIPNWLTISNTPHYTTSTNATIPESDIVLILGTNAQNIGL